MCGATEWYSKVSDVNLKMRIHWNSFSNLFLLPQIQRFINLSPTKVQFLLTDGALRSPFVSRISQEWLVMWENSAIQKYITYRHYSRTKIQYPKQKSRNIKKLTNHH